MVLDLVGGASASTLRSSLYLEQWSLPRTPLLTSMGSLLQELAATRAELGQARAIIAAGDVNRVDASIQRVGDTMVLTHPHCMDHRLDKREN